MDGNFHTRRRDPENEEQVQSDADAKFLGWQELPTGNRVAFYNIIAVKHPSYGSTVTEMSLRKLNLKVPNTPDPESESNK